MSFATGFKVGWDAAGEGLSDYRKRKMERELSRLGTDADAVQGTGLKIIGPDGKVSTAVIDPATGADLGAITKQYQDAGYQVEQAGQPQFAARAGSYDAGTFGTEGEARSASGDYNYRLANRRADLYEMYGDPQTARGLRSDATRQRTLDQQLAMQQEMHGLQKRETEGRISDQEYARNKRADLDFGIAAALELGTPEEQTAGVLEAYRRFDPKAAADLASTYSQQELSALTLRGKKLLQGFQEARMTGGLEGAVKWYSDVNDGFDAKLVRGKGGVMQLVQYDPRDPQGTARVLASGSESQISMRLEAMLTPGGFMELAKVESDIAKNDAYAAYLGRMPREGGQGGAGARRNEVSPKDVISAVDGAALMWGAAAQQSGMNVELDEKGNPRVTPGARVHIDKIARGFAQLGITPTDAMVFNAYKNNAVSRPDGSWGIAMPGGAFLPLGASAPAQAPAAADPTKRAEQPASQGVPRAPTSKPYTPPGARGVPTAPAPAAPEGFNPGEWIPQRGGGRLGLTDGYYNTRTGEWVDRGTFVLRKNQITR